MTLSRRVKTLHNPRGKDYYYGECSGIAIWAEDPFLADVHAEIRLMWICDCLASEMIDEI